jgi:hypothetical protein
MKKPAPSIPSAEWFDLKRRFYALLIREGCTPEMSEEIVRERHAMYMQNEFKAALADIAANKTALADVDKEFSGLRTALAGTSADGTVLATIIKGKALLNSIPYSLLTISLDAAGGDTKITHFLLARTHHAHAEPFLQWWCCSFFLAHRPSGKLSRWRHPPLHVRLFQVEEPKSTEDV